LYYCYTDNEMSIRCCIRISSWFFSI